MRKYIINNLIIFVIYFVFVTLVNKLFSFSYYPLYIGGLIGLFMPNIDHLLYVFVFKPHELTSQRVKAFIVQKQYKEAIYFLYNTKDERHDLIFHSVNFQVIFAVLTFWVITSSGNLFARGLVLGFLLNQLIYIKNNQKFDKHLLIGVILILALGLMV